MLNSRFTAVLLMVLLYVLLIANINLAASDCLETPQHVGTYFLYLWVYKSSWVIPLITLLILVVTMLITSIPNQYGLLRKYGLLGGVVYLLVMLLMLSQNIQVWVLISQLIILILLMTLLRPATGTDILSRFFYAGVFIGLLVLIYPPLILLAPAYLLASNVYQLLGLRRALLMLSGVLLPIVYLLSYLYLTDSIGLWYSYLPSIRGSLPHYTATTAAVVILFVIMALFFLSDLNRFKNHYNWQAQQKRMVVLYMSTGTMLSALIGPSSEPAFLMLAAPLLSLMMLMYYVNNPTSRFARAILIIFILLSLTQFYLKPF